jgi:hypothetical protein
MTMSGRKSKPNLPGAMALDDEYQDMLHNIPQPHPDRPGWLCQRAPGGGFIAWQADVRASIKPNHIDGPVVRFRNGEMHWLTFCERVLFRLGRIDAADLEYKYRPELFGVR